MIVLPNRWVLEQICKRSVARTVDETPSPEVEDETRHHGLRLSVEDHRDFPREYR